MAFCWPGELGWNTCDQTGKDGFITYWSLNDAFSDTEFEYGIPL